jgi:hypothetical protein
MRTWNCWLSPKINANDKLAEKMRKPTPSLLAISILSCLLLEGCRPLPLLSYPWFWDYTKTKPKETDVLGTYKILKLRLPGDLSNSVREKETKINLAANHTAELTEVPVFDDSGQELICRLRGSAHWDFYDQTANLGGWTLTFQDYIPATKPTAKECEFGDSMGSLLILSKQPPYRLYAMVGDPDSDTGVEFQSVSH